MKDFPALPEYFNAISTFNEVKKKWKNPVENLTTPINANNAFYFFLI